MKCIRQLLLPGVVLWPNTPLKKQGMRMLPPMSEPTPMTAPAAPRMLPSPPEDTKTEDTPHVMKSFLGAEEVATWRQDETSFSFKDLSSLPLSSPGRTGCTSSRTGGCGTPATCTARWCWWRPEGRRQLSLAAPRGERRRRQRPPVWIPILWIRACLWEGTKSKQKTLTGWSEAAESCRRNVGVDVKRSIYPAGSRTPWRTVGRPEEEVCPPERLLLPSPPLWAYQPGPPPGGQPQTWRETS